jgi:predicted RNA methylase
MLERASGPDARRRLGAWDTPRPLADALCSLALEELGRRPELVLDPTCGTGHFLIAAADRLLADGLTPGQVCERLVGIDVDPGAVATARASLAAWAHRNGADPRTADAADLRVGDALGAPLADLIGRIDLVVGNPPFLAQTASATARDAAARSALRDRFGDLGPYADTAGLFLLASLELLRDGGVSMMVQPASFLAARDAAGVRSRVLEAAGLVALWGSDELHFDAAVHVCAPVVRVGAARPGRVRVLWGGGLSPVSAVPTPESDASWGPLLAAPAGIPVVAGPPVTAFHVESLAATTAGFRDEFYALAAAAREPGEAGHDEAAPQLVTVGMIDPARSSWGVRPHRLGGRSVVAPRLDRDSLAAGAPQVADWVRRRLRPKLLVATQTRVLEAVVDEAGRWVPVTPVVSVEPHDPADVWRLLAALCSPSVAARMAAEHLGSGRSPGTLRCSAAALARVPLPIDQAAWERGALLARRVTDADGGTRGDLLRRLGRTMCEAHGVPADEDLLGWWLERAARP